MGDFSQSPHLRSYPSALKLSQGPLEAEWRNVKRGSTPRCVVATCRSTDARHPFRRVGIYHSGAQPATLFPYRIFDLRSLVLGFYVLFALFIHFTTVSVPFISHFAPGRASNFTQFVFSISITNQTKMLTPSLGFLLLAAAGIAECRSLLDVNHVHRRYKRQNEDATGLTLVASAVQSGSANDGSNDGVIAPGQSKSQVSQNNFINFCKGKTLTNGLQVQGGSCNGIRKLIGNQFDGGC